ncbi:hypothetical protein LOTGIDRAFT_111607 [Lottia gigantea]|uniref:Uncharacterized protein n=1 Tax=Lottia gigantea TaxID=225164 RepID=V4AVK4_LOTGI|nr:hypothetical protein LOTGIDRAFT_111607 [Lottia gigantea]ESP01358.1 hypothetical protein LOTGIDRAFT_111607 [Lottia gigantea]
MLPNYNNHWQEARHRNVNRQPNQHHVPYNGPVFHRPLPPTNHRSPTNPSSYTPPHHRPTYNTAYQSRGNHLPDQQQKRLPAHRHQPVPTHKEELPNHTSREAGHHSYQVFIITWRRPHRFSCLSWARRSCRKRLTQAVITKFYQTINETKTRVTIFLPTEMDTTPAPSGVTTLPNQTPKQSQNSPTPTPADIGKRS